MTDNKLTEIEALGERVIKLRAEYKETSCVKAHAELWDSTEIYKAMAGVYAPDIIAALKLAIDFAILVEARCDSETILDWRELAETNLSEIQTLLKIGGE